jgi:hypothetical protein
MNFLVRKSNINLFLATHFHTSHIMAFRRSSLWRGRLLDGVLLSSTLASTLPLAEPFPAAPLPAEFAAELPLAAQLATELPAPLAAALPTPTIAECRALIAKISAAAAALAVDLSDEEGDRLGAGS